MNLYNAINRKKVLVAAHRGTCGGNIPCNSIPAFKAAILAGADVIELDAERSLDGELFVMHPGMEKVHLGIPESIKEYPASKVEQFRLLNWDHTVTQYRLPRLEEVLNLLRGKCIVNIDKFWENPKEIADLVHKLGMEDQVIIKTEYIPKYLDAIELYASDIPYMTIVREGYGWHEELMRRNIRYVGAEVLFDSEKSYVASKHFVEQMHADGKFIWVNAIVYDDTVDLSAGHNDDISVYEDPEKGWGWLADRGFDLIQTDFVYQCRRFLESTGRRNK